jgi:hypothetical protein
VQQNDDHLLRVGVFNPASVFRNDRKGVLQFAAWPAKTPTGDALREWLNGFEPLTSEAPIQQTSPSLSQEGARSPAV